MAYLQQKWQTERGRAWGPSSSAPTISGLF
jgi:hypothetical protein